MIRLTDLGATGTESDPLDVDETQIESLALDPVQSDRVVVTMKSGNWFLVSESVKEIERLIQSA